MRKLFLLMFFVFGISFGQETLNLTKKGFEPIIVSVDDMNAELIYSKTKEWIQTYYKNPNEVLKADIKNNMIRIDGFNVGGYKMRNLGIVFPYDYSYSIEIQFKDGRYRYEYIVGQLWSDGKKCFYSYSDFFKKDGTNKSVYQLANETMTASVNENYLSLFDYITGKTQKQKSEW
jgi:hypothetical protein